MVFTATARWNFRGETWFSMEIEAHDLDLAGALFYSMLPITFFRGNHRLVAIRPQDHGPAYPHMLGAADSIAETWHAETDKRPAEVAG